MFIKIFTSVQMRLYTLHKREFVLLFLVFIALYTLCVVIGLAGPSTSSTVSLHATDIKPELNRSIMATGPFLLKSPTLSAYSQQLQVTAQIIILNEDEEETFDKTFDVNVVVYGISDKNEHMLVSDKKHNKNRTRDLHCSKKICDAITVLHLGFLEYSHYVITIRFYGLETIDEKYQITDVLFQFQSYNPAYTKMEIWFRMIFLIVTFYVTCWFSHSLRHFIHHDWSYEQKWMFVLLPLLLLYNNPIFPMSFLFNSWLPGMLDVTFQASFVSAMLFFWLCAYHGIRQNKRKFLSFYFPKCIIVGLLWISTVILTSSQKYHELQDPTFDYHLDIQNFTGFKIFFGIVCIFYFLYLACLVVKAYTEVHSMPYFDLRLKFQTFTMIIVILNSVTNMVLNIKTSILKDNFMADFTHNYSSSAQFLSFYGLLNFYLYNMAYVYSPPGNAVLESRVKDNPALSMIDDSDEEVIYGSDAEGRLLNPVQPGPDKEESD
ncbi:transmembrane protein 181-like isoform X2 [Centruroides sculpturatus]|uniref:transmembrane protein 181-like isoform X2 n=1 Tax=Centruroides sculpturatus TaxID=218467 RepID=UPI000C6CA7AA|nr:transmembrane protein 181-like isoform X2 [Centruroides sculpturatus]XP_023221992.1 transmembrane protein 181-like isoform X2 [Centruroides sculpturatus]